MLSANIIGFRMFDTFTISFKYMRKRKGPSMNPTSYFNTIRICFVIQYILCSIDKVTFEPFTNYASYTIALQFCNKML